MRAAKLRNFITIEQVTETRTSTGAFTRVWTTFAQVWAEKMENKGDEFFSADAQHSKTVVNFVIRKIAGVTTKMRISYQGRVYDIKDITDHTGRRRELEITCVEGANLG